jgi:hypothetical protein
VGSGGGYAVLWWGVIHPRSGARAALPGSRWGIYGPLRTLIVAGAKSRNLLGGLVYREGLIGKTYINLIVEGGNAGKIWVERP